MTANERTQNVWCVNSVLVIKLVSNGRLLVSFTPSLRCASKHILSWFPSPDIGMIVVGKASSVKIPRAAWLG